MLSDLDPLGADHPEVEPNEDLEGVGDEHRDHHASVDALDEHGAEDPHQQDDGVGENLERAAYDKMLPVDKGIPVAVLDEHDDIGEHE